MHIFRWLLVHPVIFAWILAFAAILLNWGVGGKAPEGGQEQHAAEVTAEHSQAAATPEAPAATEQAATTEEAPAATEQVATTEAPAAVTEAVQTGEVVTEQAQGLSAAGAVAAASASIAEQAVETTASGTAAEAAPAKEQTNAGEATADDLLRAAREAYWAGEYDRSVEFYQSLLAKDEQPAYKGELANVYWKQGNSTEAVSLYTSIAGWLAEQGRMAELNSIKVYADLVDPAKAAEIGALLK